jgi:hypothetical protein
MYQNAGYASVWYFPFMLESGTGVNDYIEMVFPAEGIVGPTASLAVETVDGVALTGTWGAPASHTSGHYYWKGTQALTAATWYRLRITTGGAIS